MKTNFGIDAMMFEAETVMAKIEEDEPSPFIEITPTEGNIVGHKFIVGEFKIKDELYENSDGNLQFSVSFLDKSKKENDKLMTLHIKTINQIVMDMISNIKVATE